MSDPKEIKLLKTIAGLAEDYLFAQANRGFVAWCGNDPELIKTQLQNALAELGKLNA